MRYYLGGAKEDTRLRKLLGYSDYCIYLNTYPYRKFREENMEKRLSKYNDGLFVSQLTAYHLLNSVVFCSDLL